MNAMVNIHPNASIGKDVTLSPFSTIEDNVEIGDGTWIGPNVTIMEGARIGKNCKIYPGAVISAAPQDLKYKGENTLTYVGDNTTIREAVTINRGTTALGYTKVGNNCLIMAYAHVAHDCIIGDNAILVNYVGLAGHVEVGDWAIIGGMAPVHQFTKIGPHSLIAGATHVRKDVPPFVKAAREPISFAGINTLGLRRRGFDNDQISAIQATYRILFQSGLSISKAIQKVEDEIAPSNERDLILQFINESDRGVIRGFMTTKNESESENE